MPHVDKHKLETDVSYRFNYLTSFMGLRKDDISAIQAVTPELANAIPMLVDAVYIKLYEYDITWKYFSMHQSGYDGKATQSNDRIEIDHPHILYRKKHLAKYLERLVTQLDDPNLIDYLNTVGKMHTKKAGNEKIHVPLIHMNALMGYVGDALIEIIMSFSQPNATKIQAIRGFTKLLWIQSDLISRHYNEAQNE